MQIQIKPYSLHGESFKSKFFYFFSKNKLSLKILNFFNDKSTSLYKDKINLWKICLYSISVQEKVFFSLDSIDILLYTNFVIKNRYKISNFNLELDSSIIDNFEKNLKESILNFSKINIDLEQDHAPILDLEKKELIKFNFWLYNFFTRKRWGFIISVFEGWIIYELMSSFQWQNFFLFWTKISKSLRQFQWENSLRNWVFLMDEHLFSFGKKKKSILINLKNLQTCFEMWTGLKILKKFFRFYLRTKSKFLEQLVDVQSYIFDKNFYYLWNYRKAFLKKFDFMLKGWMLWRTQAIWNWLILPSIQFPSQFSNLNWPYKSIRANIFSTGLFIFNIPQMGLSSFFLDFCTLGYNRFFWAAWNYIDSLELLQSWKYQVSHVYWGPFESMVTDYKIYQGAYFIDSIGTLWLPLMILLSRDYKSWNQFWKYMVTYANIFQLKLEPTYKKKLKSSELFSLSKYDWLKKFWDWLPIEEKVHNWAWVSSIFFGYNKSFIVLNDPYWINLMGFSSTFPKQIKHHRHIEDEVISLQKKIRSSLNLKYLRKNFNFSIFFESYSSYFYINNYLNFFYEYIYDEVPYFESHFKEPFLGKGISYFSLFNFFRLFYSYDTWLTNKLWIDFLISNSALNYQWFNFIKFFKTSKTYFLDISLDLERRIDYIISSSLWWIGLISNGWIGLVYSLNFNLKNNFLFNFIERFMFFYWYTVCLFFDFLINKNFLSWHIYLSFIKFLEFYGVWPEDSAPLQKIIVVLCAHFFYWNLFWTQPIVKTNHFHFIKLNLSVLSLESVNYTCEPFQYRYFVFYSSFNKDLFVQTIRRNLFTSLIFNNIFIKENFSNISFQDYENFLLFWLINYQNNLHYQPNSLNFILELNEFSTWDLKKKFLELERYNNFILRQKTYKKIA